MAPAVKARRRVVQLLGDKKAARVLFERIAPRFMDRPGGYTRILKLATPRLGDAGPRALLEFVGNEAGGGAPAPRVESARPART
jgi:large subunit ribosomal protein L17